MRPRTQKRKPAMIKVSAMIPVTHENALKQQAEDEGRSLASEIRIAIHERLKKHGRIV